MYIIYKLSVSPSQWRIHHLVFQVMRPRSSIETKVLDGIDMDRRGRKGTMRYTRSRLEDAGVFGLFFEQLVPGCRCTADVICVRLLFLRSLELVHREGGARTTGSEALPRWTRVGVGRRQERHGFAGSFDESGWVAAGLVDILFRGVAPSRAR